MDFEIDRLVSNGYEELSKLVQRISLIDSSAGYDIVSFSGKGKFPESKRYIEVKGTQANNIQFIWSRNERKVAERLKNKYWLYCYTEVDINRKTAVGPYKINNPKYRLTNSKFESESSR